jgi:hypothetical protein
MPYSGILRRVALVKPNVSRERVAFLRSMLRLLVTANVPSSPIIVIHMMEAIHSFEMSVLTRAARRHIPEDGILHSHRRGTHKSYKLHEVANPCIDILVCRLTSILRNGTRVNTGKIRLMSLRYRDSPLVLAISLTNRDLFRLRHPSEATRYTEL